MARRTTKKRETEDDLSCFQNQPNINMTIPWIKEMADAVAAKDAENDEQEGEGDEEEDKFEKGLECF